MRGDGSVYLRGKRWWIVYFRGGQRFREPGGATKTAAREHLKTVHKALREGTYQTPAERAVTVGELLDDLLVHLQVSGAASTPKARSHLKAVRDALGQVRAHQLRTVDVERYQQARLAAGRAPATVNRECELLRQAYRRALRVTPPRVRAAPYVPWLKAHNARQGFLSRAEAEALLATIPDDDARDYLEWFWRTGMRPNEIRQLSWSMLDREAWTLNLDPKAEKTRKGRVLAIVRELRTIIDRRLAKRRLDSHLIFHRPAKVFARGEDGKVLRTPDGRRVCAMRQGQPIRDISRAWRAALAAAKLPAGLRPYDLRRTALRNMVRGGVDPAVAMRISGHRTRATFDRYNITSAEDIRAALERTADYVDAQPATRNVAEIRTTAEQPQKRHNRVQSSKARSR